MEISLTQLASDLISKAGYTGLLLGLFIDSFGIPVPSEILLGLGGALSKTGRFNVWAILILGTMAQVAGAYAGYLIGRYGGEPFLRKYGKYLLISQRDLKRVHELFEKHGPVLTIVGRCLPVIRGLVAYPAGIADMNLKLFLMYSSIGAAVWSIVFVSLGYWAGDKMHEIDGIMKELSFVVIALIIIWVVWHFRHLWQRETEKE